jgi:hypothetical protein
MSENAGLLSVLRDKKTSLSAHNKSTLIREENYDRSE